MNDKIGTITGTMTIEIAWKKQKKKLASFMHALRT